MITFLVFFGLILLIWSNFFVSLAGLLILMCILAKYHTDFAVINSNKLRVFGEITCFILAIAGFWFLPFIPAAYAHFAAVVAALAIAQHISDCLRA